MIVPEKPCQTGLAVGVFTIGRKVSNFEMVHPNEFILKFQCNNGTFQEILSLSRKIFSALCCIKHVKKL